MLAYRLIAQESLLKSRSFCPSCKHIIAWYDNIPLLSWMILGRKCRTCKTTISWLYPLIELSTLLIFIGLMYFLPSNYWLAYALFFSALLITIRTDLEHMLISRFVSIFLVPVGVALSYFEFLPISWLESIIGACSAYCWLFGISYIFFKITKKVGMGQGDYELMAFIGSFLGILGWWFALLIGSFLGAVVGIMYLLLNGKKTFGVKIPFGPFLAVGAILYVFCQECILKCFY